MIDSRASREGATIRRRRECLACAHRFTTYEHIERASLMVVKRDERREEFSREKLVAAIQRACQKRPVTQDQIEDVAEKIIDALSSEYDREVPYTAVGARVMEWLRGLDPIAYVRFASVYRRFDEAAEFVQEVKKLETKHDTLTARLPGI